MNISSAGSAAPSAGADYVSGASASFTHAPMESWTQRLDSPTGQKFLQAIAQTTGQSAATVTTQLQSGQTLHDILSSKGVTFGQVRQAVRAQGQGGVPGGHHHAASATAPASSSPFFTTLAGKLGLTSDQLTQDLQSGQGLDQIGAAQGLSSDQLAAAVQDSIKAVGLYTSSATRANTSVPPGQLNGLA